VAQATTGEITAAAAVKPERPAVADFAADALPFEDAAGAAPFEDPAGALPFEQAVVDTVEAHDASPAPEPDHLVSVESPDTAPANFDAGEPPIDGETVADGAIAIAETHEDIESVAARRAPGAVKRAARRWPLSWLQSAILTLIIVDAIIVGWRTDFVRAMPQTASFYSWIGLPVNLRGLRFDGVGTASEQHDGVPILVVEGNVVNGTGTVTEVPHLRFAVRNAARQEIYSWTAIPSRTTLPPGEAVSFHTRLASPPPDAHDVLIRFVNRYDMLSGAR
jgi:hypothetical protein